MIMPKKIAAIVNPCAAGGETARRWPALQQLIERSMGPIAPRFSDAPRAATSITRELLHQGFDLVIAVGGDGTINEVANGFFENDQFIGSGSKLGVLPIGTGGDFRRTLGIPQDPSAAVKILSDGAALLIDVGKAQYQAADGAPDSRYFVNLVSFGMGGSVAARSKNPLRALGGKAAFLWATMETFLTYRGRKVTLKLDSAPPAEFFVTNVAIGNGQFHGGGMRPCPTALLNDGVLEVTVIEYASALKLISNLPVLYSGEIYRHPKVRHLQAVRLWAESAAETRIEVDGEPLGRLPLEISILPRQLPVLVDASSPLLGLSK